MSPRIAKPRYIADTYSGYKECYVSGLAWKHFVCPGYEFLSRAALFLKLLNWVTSMTYVPAEYLKMTPNIDPTVFCAKACYDISISKDYLYSRNSRHFV